MLRVLIDLPVLERITHFVDLAKGEVSCLGLVDKDGENLIIREIFLPRQACSSSSTEMDQEDVAKLLLDLENNGKDQRSLRLWLHSHADMDTFWSTTDTDTIEELCNDGFLVSIVTNKAGKILTRVDVFNPFRFTMDKVTTEPMLPDFGLRDECEAEIKAKVRTGRPVLSPDKKNGHGPDLVEIFDDMTWAHEQMELDRQLQSGEITFREYLEQADGGEWP